MSAGSCPPKQRDGSAEDISGYRRMAVAAFRMKPRTIPGRFFTKNNDLPICVHQRAGRIAKFGRVPAVGRYFQTNVHIGTDNGNVYIMRQKTASLPFPSRILRFRECRVVE